MNTKYENRVYELVGKLEITPEVAEIVLNELIDKRAIEAKALAEAFNFNIKR